MDKRNCIEANKAYLTECFTVVVSKIRAHTFMFSTKDGEELSKKYINFEGSTHGSVSVHYTPEVTMISLDGTNFTVLFSKKEQGKLDIYNKELGLRYTIADIPISDSVEYKSVARCVGNEVESYKYTSFGTFYVLLEYKKIDKDGHRIIIKRKDLSDLTREDLINESIESYCRVMEIEDEDYEKLRDSVDEEIESFTGYVEEDDSLMSYDSASESLVENFSGDICVVDYTKDSTIKASESDEPYECNLPEDVKDYDYQKYVNNSFSQVDEEDLPTAIQQDVVEDSLGEEASTVTIYADNNLIRKIENGDYEESEDYPEEDPTIDSDYDEDFEDGEGVTSMVGIDEEGFIDPEKYVAYRDGKMVESFTMEDMLDMATMDLLDVNQEMEEMEETYEEIRDAIKSIEQIVKARKSRADKMKKKKPNADPADGGENR